jgi:hypothetical protein
MQGTKLRLPNVPLETTQHPVWRPSTAARRRIAPFAPGQIKYRRRGAARGRAPWTQPVTTAGTGRDGTAAPAAGTRA